jgi:hypothetical protein
MIYFKKIVTWVSKNRPVLEKIITIGVLFLSLSFLILVLSKGWYEVVPYLKQINFLLLLAGLCSTFVALLLGGLMWWLVQKGVGLGLGLYESIAIQFTSDISKYIPGYAWQYMSKAYLVNRSRKTPTRQIGIAIMSEFILLTLGGAGFAGLLAWIFNLDLPLRWQIPHWLWLVITGSCLLVILLWIIWVPRLLVGQRISYDGKTLWLAMIVGLIGWLIFSLAVWLIARSLFPLRWDGFPQVGFALALSGIIGIVVIFAPNGIGVREATMTLLLQGLLPLPIGAVVSVLVRLSVILGELICFALVFRKVKQMQAYWQLEP